MALRWPPCWIAAGLFGASALALAAGTFRPVVEIHETHLLIGRRMVQWREIVRVDQTSWQSPLAGYLTLADGERVLILYAGEVEACAGLLRHLRRFSRDAVLDGISYREFWGESAAAPLGLESEPVKYQLLRPEDEEEVERMFHQLKSAGHIESRNADED